MPTPQKTTTKAATAKAAAAAPLDLNALKALSVNVKDVAAPVRSTSTPVADNPFLSAVRDSWSKRVEMTPARTVNGAAVAATHRGSGKMVERVPADNVKQVEALLRQAALAVGAETKTRVGVAIQVDALTGANKGYANVRFCAKTAKQGRAAKAAAAAVQSVSTTTA